MTGVQTCLLQGHSPALLAIPPWVLLATKDISSMHNFWSATHEIIQEVVYK